MKNISHEQSRRNAALSRRRVAGRHALARHWDDQPRAMFGSGPVAYEIGGNIDATCFGGVAAVHRLVTKLGLLAGFIAVTFYATMVLAGYAVELVFNLLHLVPAHRSARILEPHLSWNTTWLDIAFLILAAALLLRCCCASSPRGDHRCCA